MKPVLTVVLGCAVALWAESNISVEHNRSSAPAAEKVHPEKKKEVEEAIRQQIEREKKYAKEQKFYQGDEYDLDAHKVDPKSVDKVPAIEPEYDFDMTDVYSD